MFHFKITGYGWTDGSPVTYTDWITPAKTHNITDVKVQIIVNAHTTYKPRTNKDFAWELYNELLSGKLNSKYRCTAIYYQRLRSPFPWIKIPCDKPLPAKFICMWGGDIKQTFLKSIFPKYNLLHRQSYGLKHDQQYVLLCKKGWKLMGNKCFYPLTVKYNMNAITAQKECNKRDSTLLYLGDVFFNSVFHIFPFLKKDFNFQQIQIAHTRNRNNVKDKPLMTLEIRPGDYRVANLLRFVADLIMHDDVMATENIWAFDTLSNSCILLTTGYAYAYYIDRIKTANGIILDEWIARIVDCGSGVYIDSLICEHIAHKQRLSCDWEKQFTCNASSCILKMYFCDGKYDCPFGDDEYMNCNNESYFLEYISSYKHDSPRGYVAQQRAHCQKIFRNVNDIILVHLFCNGKLDCYDGTDEDFCKEIYHIPRDRNYKDNSFINEYQNNNSIALHRNALKPLKLSCLTHLYSFDEICNYDTDRETKQISHCSAGYHLDNCDTMECPGMFKCMGSYCIDVWRFCDGIVDCYSGEDEPDCTNLSCPGLFKCHGENKCLGQWQVCNGYVDCKTTMDDELFCESCPDNCICFGYAVWCSNVSLLPHYISAYTIRSLVTDQVTHTFWLIVKELRNFLFLDISFSKLFSLDFIQPEKDIEWLILSLNVSRNNLKYIKFDSFYQFKVIHTIDISYNYITTLHTINDIELLHLTTLLLNDNSITALSNNQLNLPYLAFLNLRNNPLFYLEPQCFGVLRNLTSLHASSARLCCFLGFKSSCMVEGEPSWCHHTRLMHTIYHTGISSILALTVLICNIFSCKYHLFKKKHSTSSYGTIVLNQSLSGLLNSLHIVVLVAADLVVNEHFLAYMNIWNTGHVCATLNLVSFIHIISSVVFVFTKSLFAFCRTKFPFRHQCRWMKYCFLIIVILWLACVGISYIPKLLLVRYGIRPGKDFSGSNICFLLFNSETQFGVFFNISIIFLGFYLICLIGLVILQKMVFTLSFSTNLSFKMEELIRKRQKKTFILKSIPLMSSFLTVGITIITGFSSSSDDAKNNILE